MVQQVGKPQEIYDDPANLFVARFLGTPPINVFEGEIRDGGLYIGMDRITDAPISNRPVYVGIRPEGFIPDENGSLRCTLKGIDVMGRDISILSTHPAALVETVRSIINSDQKTELGTSNVSFSVKPSKLFIFDKETEARIYLN